MTESPCSAFEASSRSPSFLICPFFHLFIRICPLTLSIRVHCLFLHLVLSSGVSVLVIILPFPLHTHPPQLPPLLTLSFCCSPCLSASCYCNHLFTQPVAHFLPSPVSYSLILSDFMMLTQEKALLLSPPTTATNSDHVSLLVAQL